ncbi:hypothetical protein DSM100688_0017 [Bifidobacterium ramosum]|uniref:Uncharacterized protein n=1 Tax=Bifidobacterium ramosum TaxID=1798158 RepID=A0A6L4X1G7_9BIFI|nr:hypothetical protein DSM100688_0017 [Bifidobacterium ramosum]
MSVRGYGHDDVAQPYPNVSNGHPSGQTRLPLTDIQPMWTSFSAVCPLGVAMRWGWWRDSENQAQCAAGARRAPRAQSGARMAFLPCALTSSSSSGVEPVPTHTFFLPAAIMPAANAAGAFG